MPTLWLFNPPAPHADPVGPGLTAVGNAAGQSISVPRYWRTLPQNPPGANDLTTLFFGQAYCLSRVLAPFEWMAGRGADPRCQWQANFPVNIPGLQPVGFWRLRYSSGALTDTEHGWTLECGVGPPDTNLDLYAAYNLGNLSPASWFDPLNANRLPNLPSPTTFWLGSPPPFVSITPFWA